MPEHDPQLPLARRHALVGGASRGIGRATAHALAAAGASCTLLARSEDALREVAAELPTGRDQHHGILAVDQLDVADLAARLGELASRTPVHVWINNTGGPKGGPLAEADPEDLARAFRQHVLAAQVILRAVLPGMRAAGYGRIVNVVSTSVKAPIPGLGVSNTVRGAMANWAKTLAGELAADGITVNNVLPGFTDTDRLREIIAARARRAGNSEEAVADGMRAGVPAGRFASAAETAAAIAFLAGPSAGYVNGVNLPVDGGRTPSL